MLPYTLKDAFYLLFILFITCIYIAMVKVLVHIIFTIITFTLLKNKDICKCSSILIHKNSLNN